MDITVFPTINALLNGLSTVFILTAYYHIRRKKERLHRNFMLAATITSALFLTSYVTYHSLKEAPVSYAGSLPWLYYPILISHIFLAAVIPVLVLISLYLGWKDKRVKHRRMARITLPVWLYVSVTGILIYGMLYL